MYYQTLVQSVFCIKYLDKVLLLPEVKVLVSFQAEHLAIAFF